MFSDDRFMTLATGLVLAIVVGTVAQKSDSIMAFFGSSDIEATEADQFTVRAGKSQALDVLANDTLKGDIVITQAPSCGSVRLDGNGAVEYMDSGTCSGDVTFSYCIDKDGVCDETLVGLNVVNPNPATTPATSEVANAQPSASTGFFTDAQPEETVAETQPAATETAVADTPADTANTADPIVTADSGSDDRLVPKQILLQEEDDTAVVGFGVANAPALFAPDMAELIQPKETVDTLRRSVAAIAPSRVDVDQNLGTQTSAGTPSRVNLSNGGLQSAPVLGTEASPVVAFASPSQPRLMAAPMLAPVQQDKPIVRGPEVVATTPENITVASSETSDQPVSVSETMDVLAALAVADAPYGQEPANPPENVDTQSAEAGDVRVAADDPSDSSDIVVEMAAQILLPGPQLTQSLEYDDQTTTPEAAALLSDQNFVANLEPSEPPKEETQVASLPAATAAVPSVPDASTAATSCDTRLSASTRPGAEISLIASSPCHAGEIVKIEHAGLVFTLRMNAQGQLSTEVPALTKAAKVTLTFEDGSTAQSQLQVRDANSLERVAVIWSAPVELDLHAYENGATGNAVGHVWSGNPRKYRDTLTGGGGFLNVYGDPGIIGGTFAEVYSLPTSRLRNETTVKMDLSINDATQACGQTMLLQTVRTSKDSEPVKRSFNLALPSCANATNELVLENFVSAISVARR